MFLSSDMSVLLGRTTVGSFSTKMGQKLLRDSPLGYFLQNLQILGLTEIINLNWISTVTQSITNVSWRIITIDKKGHFQFPNSAWSQKLSSMLWNMFWDAPISRPLFISPLDSHSSNPVCLIIFSSLTKIPLGFLCLPLKSHSSSECSQLYVTFSSSFMSQYIKKL
jgi:hypothetical protein